MSPHYAIVRTLLTRMPGPRKGRDVVAGVHALADVAPASGNGLAAGLMSAIALAGRAALKAGAGAALSSVTKSLATAAEAALKHMDDAALKLVSGAVHGGGSRVSGNDVLITAEQQQFVTHGEFAVQPVKGSTDHVVVTGALYLGSLRAYRNSAAGGNVGELLLSAALNPLTVGERVMGTTPNKLSRLAGDYSYHRPLAVRLEWIPRVGTDAKGSVVFAFQPDVSRAPPPRGEAGVRQVMEDPRSTSTVVWGSLTVPFDVLGEGNMLNVRPRPMVDIASEDPRMRAGGRVLVMVSSDIPDELVGQDLGIVRLVYMWELYKESLLSWNPPAVQQIILQAQGNGAGYWSLQPMVDGVPGVLPHIDEGLPDPSWSGRTAMQMRAQFPIWLQTTQGLQRVKRMWGFLDTGVTPYGSGINLKRDAADTKFAHPTLDNALAFPLDLEVGGFYIAAIPYANMYAPPEVVDWDEQAREPVLRSEVPTAQFGHCRVCETYCTDCTCTSDPGCGEGGGGGSSASSGGAGVLVDADDVELRLPKSVAQRVASRELAIRRG